MHCLRLLNSFSAVLLIACVCQPENVLANTDVENLRTEWTVAGEHIPAMYWAILGVAILWAIAMTFAVVSFRRRLAKPIKNVTDALDEVVEKSGDIAFSPSGQKEVAALEESVTALAKQLRDYHRTTNRELQHLRIRLEECFNNFPHPIFFVNNRREIFYRNDSARQLIEDTRWETGRLLDTLDNRLDSVFGTGEESLATEFKETLTYRGKGIEQYFLPLLIRIDDEDTEEIECGVILQDVTSLRLSDNLKSDLVATVSHELKTPVTSATMALHLVGDGSLGDLNEDQKDMVNTAVSDLQRLQKLLENLLQIASLESPQPSLNFQSCEIGFFVESVFEFYEREAETKSVRLRKDLHPNLPLVKADPKAIELALSNFLSNAIKYSPEHSEIVVYAKVSEGGGIRVGVLDEGPGLQAADTERVFDKFYRVKTEENVDGVGLGLSISKDIIRAHDGSIGCQNRAQGGSDFYFELPAS